MPPGPGVDIGARPGAARSANPSNGNRKNMTEPISLPGAQDVEIDSAGNQHSPSFEPGWSGSVWSDRLLEGIVAFAIVGELLVILLNIGSRVVTGNSILWTQEVSELALLTIAFVGGAIAYPAGRAHVGAGADHAASAALETVSHRGHRLARVRHERGSVRSVPAQPPAAVGGATPILGLRVFWVSLPFAVGMVLIAWFACLKLWRQGRRTGWHRFSLRSRSWPLPVRWSSPASPR